MTDDEKAELADVYERAAEYLEKYGWIKRLGGLHGGPRCFIGATFSVTCEGRSSKVSLWKTSSEFAAEVLELDRFGLVGWNDEPDRTKDEVINTLHALANKLR